MNIEEKLTKLLSHMNKLESSGRIYTLNEVKNSIQFKEGKKNISVVFLNSGRRVDLASVCLLWGQAVCFCHTDVTINDPQVLKGVNLSSGLVSVTYNTHKGTLGNNLFLPWFSYGEHWILIDNDS